MKLLVAGVEMTADRSFTMRVRRLVVVSVIALGAITVLAATTTDAPIWVLVLLAYGWLAMPLLLALSVRRPVLRYGLVVPATSVVLGLLALSAWWLPSATIAAVGWLSITVGIASGSVLGLWLWYRLFPVPSTMEDPFAPKRMVLIAVHAGLIVVGIALVLVGAT